MSGVVGAAFRRMSIRRSSFMSDSDRSEENKLKVFRNIDVSHVRSKILHKSLPLHNYAIISIKIILRINKSILI